MMIFRVIRPMKTIYRTIPMTDKKLHSSQMGE